jgi:hypothetical protein
MERIEAFGLIFGERMLDDTVDPRPTRTAAEAVAELVEVPSLSGRQHFYLAVFRVADPSAQLELAGLTLHEPAKAYALNTTLNKEMDDHRTDLCQCCRCARRGATG